jgi:biopolymer transport protein ExbB
MRTAERHRGLLLSLLLLLALALPLTAGAALGGEAAPPVEVRSTYWELLRYGWQFNLTLGVLLFLAAFLFFHVMLITRRKLTVPGRLLQELLDDIASGDIERACQRASASRSLLGQVVLPALKLHDHPVERLHQVSEGAGRRAVSALRQQATYLANIGSLSPMIGLLGTVYGMVTAFQSFEAELELSVKQQMLTGAIGEALITTASGLLVGIPAMAAYYYAIGRVNRTSDELELATENVIACLRETK